MNDLTVVFGYGACGKATTERLAAAGRPVRVAQRRAPAALPPGVTFQVADILDAGAVRRAAEGAGHIVIALGFEYKGTVWRDVWPRAMANILAAAEAVGARVVFVDNLYMYGPQTAPLREDMALTGRPVKPAVRAEITRLWMAASAAGRVKFAALRAPDFYGPGVGALSHLGDVALGALAKGRSAMMLALPDMPHEFAYVPDIGRAVVTLIDAPDDCYGQAWHVPCAPTRAPRELLAIGAAALRVKLRFTALPFWLQGLMSLAMPMLRELAEMRFQWDRPYRVDSSKFARRFWADATPFEVGVAATARAYRQQL